ncbi:MAG TPA: 3-oxoadipate enol-lactonase [Arenicellales bacterium]|nr:3-oxoadipate enol-lactonase [Arenicellales bacterium]
MQAANVNGINIHYRSVGRDAGPTLVFVNSLGTDWRVWERVADRFADRFQLVFHDKRGHGLSDAGSGGVRISDHAADVGALLDELAITDAVVCGISVGGMIALELAAARPELVRALVLCDTGHRIGTAELWNGRIAAIREHGMDAVADGALERWFSESFRSARAAETALWRNMLLRTPVEAYTATCAAIRDADLTDSAGAVRVPALCLCGSEDQSTPPELMRELAALLADGRYREIAGAGHLPTVECADEVALRMSAFFEELKIA